MQLARVQQQEIPKLPNLPTESDFDKRKNFENCCCQITSYFESKS